MKPSDTITIAAATYNRPDGLQLLLDRLEQLTFNDGEPQIEVIIVDNTPDATARAAVQRRALAYRWPLHYSHQESRGIAHARNRALDVADNLNVQWLAFIDDDEYPDAAWIEQMRAVAIKTQATAVVGAVAPDFETQPRDWMVAGGFFAIQRYEQAAPLNFGNTSNVLFDMRFVRQHGLRFNLGFSLTGGEDTLFFDELQQLGGTIVFCRTGLVHETIVPHRATLGWLIKRWVRSGNTDGRILMHNQPGTKTRLVKVIGGGLVRTLVGGVMALVTAPMAMNHKAEIPIEHLRVASRGVGFVLSGFNSTIEEYRTMTR